MTAGVVAIRNPMTMSDPPYPPRTPVGNPRGTAVAVYALGTDLVPAGQDTKLNLVPGGLHPLTATGTPVVGTGATTFSNLNNYTADFGLDDLIAANGAATIAVLHKSAVSASHALVNSGGGTPSFALSDGGGASGGAVTITTPTRTTTVPYLADRGTRFELLVVRVSDIALQISRGYGSTITVSTGLTFASQSIAATGNFRIGNHSTAITNEIALLAFFDDWLTDAELFYSLLTDDTPSLLLESQEWLAGAGHGY